MALPRISVLIPTYNYARYLPEAIESVLEQDLRDLEVLISDDGSTDGSAEVIACYAAKDSRIRFQIHPANLGMVQNWNWCLSAARGEYIKFLFGDDKLASRQALRKLLELLETNPSAALAASARYVVGNKSETLEIWDAFRKPGVYNGAEVITRCLDGAGNLIGEPSAVLFRRRDAAGGVNLRYQQLVDEEMWLRLLERGDLAYTTEPLCCFRKHARQQSELNKPAQVAKFEALRLFWEYHNKPYLRAKGLRQGLFSQLHDLRKCRKRHLRLPEDVLVIERELSAKMSQFWYAAFWSRRRVIRPFQQLQRWRKRHWLRAAPTQALRQTECQPLRDSSSR